MFRSSQPKGFELKRFFNPRQPALSIASRDLTVTSDSSTVNTVAKLMLNRYRRVPVVSNNMELSGIVTIIDILNFLGGGEKFKLYSRKANGIDMPVKNIKNQNVHTINPNMSILKSLKFFRNRGKGAYPLIQNGILKGIISEWDFIENMTAPVDVRVESIMTHKPIIARKDYSVWDAAKMMCRGGFRRLPVTEQDILLGIVTPYDIISYLVKGERVSKHKLQSARVSSVMNRFVTTIEPDISIIETIELMRNKKVGGLPVIEDEELVGIITERDILNALVI